MKRRLILSILALNSWGCKQRNSELRTVFFDSEDKSSVFVFKGGEKQVLVRKCPVNTKIDKSKLGRDEINQYIETVCPLRSDNQKVF